MAGSVPAIGAPEAVAAGRLAMVSGAPGSGKTAVVPAVRTALAGVVVLDLDQFLEPGCRLAGLDLRRPAAADRWPAYNDLCLTFVAVVLAAGRDVLVLSPLTPEEVRRSSAAPVLGEVRWAVLDCSDTCRLGRLRSRGDADADIAGALADAADLRGLGLPVLRTDGMGVDAAAGLVSRWVRGRLTAPARSGQGRMR